MKKQSNKQPNTPKRTVHSAKRKANIRSKKVSQKIDGGYLNDLNLNQAVKLLNDNLANIRLVIFTIYEEELWVECYDSFPIFIEQVLNNLCGKSTVYRNIKAAEIDLALGYPIGTVPITIAEVLADKSLCPKRKKKIWLRAQKISKKEVPTIASLKECIETHKSAKAAYKWITKPMNWDYLLDELKTKNRSKLKNSLNTLLNTL